MPIALYTPLKFSHTRKGGHDYNTHIATEQTLFQAVRYSVCIQYSLITQRYTWVRLKKCVISGILYCLHTAVAARRQARQDMVNITANMSHMRKLV